MVRGEEEGNERGEEDCRMKGIVDVCTRDIEYRISDVPNAREDGIYNVYRLVFAERSSETQRRKWRLNETGILEPVLSLSLFLFSSRISR